MLCLVGAYLFLDPHIFRTLRPNNLGYQVSHKEFVKIRPTVPDRPKIDRPRKILPMHPPKIYFMAMRRRNLALVTRVEYSRFNGGILCILR
jgi:hypothetical protein